MSYSPIPIRYSRISVMSFRYVAVSMIGSFWATVSISEAFTVRTTMIVFFNLQVSCTSATIDYVDCIILIHNSRCDTYEITFGEEKEWGLLHLDPFVYPRAQEWGYYTRIHLVFSFTCLIFLCGTMIDKLYCADISTYHCELIYLQAN